eukprot:2506940-Pyramimonas_sp.AAC.1
MHHPSSIQRRTELYLGHVCQLRSGGRVVIAGDALRGVIGQCVPSNQRHNAAWGRLNRRGSVVEPNAEYNVDIVFDLLVHELGYSIPADDWAAIVGNLTSFLQQRASAEGVV